MATARLTEPWQAIYIRANDLTEQFRDRAPFFEQVVGAALRVLGLQAAVVQVGEQGRKGAVELRQQVLFEAAEVVAVRVPAAGALALVRDRLVLLPEDGDERHARLDKPAGEEQTR